MAAIAAVVDECASVARKGRCALMAYKRSPVWEKVVKQDDDFKTAKFRDLFPSSSSSSSSYPTFEF